jgi:predicted Zn-dependent peptidase
MQKPNFQRKKLKNGMTVLFEKRDNEIVSIAFVVKQGGVNETVGEKGISHFIEHMLYKGTEKRNSKQISAEIEKNGGVLNGFTDEELTAYWCKIPSKHIEVALDVLSDMVKNPKFDEKEIEKERKVIFEEMKMYKDNPRLYVIDEGIKKALYEGDFSVPLIGTEDSMKINTRKKLNELFKKVYSPENMVLCVVGDVSFEKICGFAEKNFSGKGKTSTKITIKKINTKIIEKRKGIDQANLIFAYHVPEASKKERVIAQVLSCIMVGGMSSRLFQEIREKRNLAYSIKGDYIGGKEYGYNFIFVGTSTENVEKVRELILLEFKKLKGLTEKELEEAKEQLIGNNKISQEDSQEQMVNLISHEISGKAEEAYEFEKNIREVKLEDVKRLADFKDYSFFALVPE